MIENNLPESWEVVKLVEGLNFLPTGVKEFNGTKKYFSTGSVQEKEISPEGEFTFVNRPSRANRIAEIGDVLQARMKATDKGLLINEILDEQLFSTGFLQVRPYGKTYNNKLLYYLLKSPLFLSQKNELATGSTQEALTDSGASEIEIPLPPIAEQHRIVIKLDALMQNIDSNKQRLEKIPRLLKQFRQSILVDAFNGSLTKKWREENESIVSPLKSFEIILSTRQPRKRATNINEDNVQLEIPDSWIKTNIDSVADWVVDCPHSTPKWSPIGKICLRTSNFFPNKLNISEVKYVSDTTYLDRIARLKPAKGDILYSREGGILGIACILDLEDDVCLGQRMMLFRLNPNIDNRFVCYLLNSPIILKHVQSLIGGSAAPHINVGDIKEYPIPFPSFEEQKEIVRKVEKLFFLADKLEEKFNKAKATLDSLSQSILTKAFRGELVAQNPEDEPASTLLEKIKVEKERLIAEKKNKKTKEYALEEKPLKIAAEKRAKYKKVKA